MGACCVSSLSASNQFNGGHSQPMSPGALFPSHPSDPTDSPPSTPIHRKSGATADSQPPSYNSNNRLTTSVNINGTCVAIPWGIHGGGLEGRGSKDGTPVMAATAGPGAYLTQGATEVRSGPRLGRVQQRMKAAAADRSKHSPSHTASSAASDRPTAEAHLLSAPHQPQPPLPITEIISNHKRSSESKTDLSNSTNGGKLPIGGWCDATAAPRTPTSSSVSRTPLHFFRLPGEEEGDVPVKDLQGASAPLSLEIVPPTMNGVTHPSGAPELESPTKLLLGDVTDQQNLMSAPTALPVPLQIRKQPAKSRLQQIEASKLMIQTAANNKKKDADNDAQELYSPPMQPFQFSSVLPASDAKRVAGRIANPTKSAVLLSSPTDPPCPIINLSPKSAARRKAEEENASPVDNYPSEQPTQLPITDFSTPQNISLLLDAAWYPGTSGSYSRQSFQSEARRVSSGSNLRNAGRFPRSSRRGSYAAQRRQSRDYSQRPQHQVASQQSSQFEHQNDQTTNHTTLQTHNYYPARGGLTLQGVTSTEDFIMSPTLPMGRAARIASSASPSTVASPTSPSRRQSTAFASPRVSIARTSSSAEAEYVVDELIQNDSLFCAPSTQQKRSSSDPSPASTARGPGAARSQQQQPEISESHKAAIAQRKALLESFLSASKLQHQRELDMTSAIAKPSNVTSRVEPLQPISSSAAPVGPSCVRINMDPSFFSSIRAPPQPATSSSGKAEPSMLIPGSMATNLLSFLQLGERSYNHSASNVMAPSMRSTTVAEAMLRSALCGVQLGNENEALEPASGSSKVDNTHHQETSAPTNGKSAAALEAETRFYDHIRRAMSLPSLTSTSARPAVSGSTGTPPSARGGRSPSLFVSSPLLGPYPNHKRTISDFMVGQPIAITEVSSRPTTPATGRHTTAAALFLALNSGNAVDKDDNDVYGSMMASRSVSFAVASTAQSAAAPALGIPSAWQTSAYPIHRRPRAGSEMYPLGMVEPGVGDATISVAKDSVTPKSKLRPALSPLVSSSASSPTSHPRPAEAVPPALGFCPPYRHRKRSSVAGGNVGVAEPCPNERSLALTNDFSLFSNAQGDESEGEAVLACSPRNIVSIHGDGLLTTSQCMMRGHPNGVGFDSDFTVTTTSATTTGTSASSGQMAGAEKFAPFFSPTPSGAAITGFVGGPGESYTATMPLTARRDIELTLTDVTSGVGGRPRALDQHLDRSLLANYYDSNKESGSRPESDPIIFREAEEQEEVVVGPDVARDDNDVLCSTAGSCKLQSPYLTTVMKTNPVTFSDEADGSTAGPAPSSNTVTPAHGYATSILNVGDINRGDRTHVNRTHGMPVWGGSAIKKPTSPPEGGGHIIPTVIAPLPTVEPNREVQSPIEQSTPIIEVSALEYNRDCCFSGPLNEGTEELIRSSDLSNYVFMGAADPITRVAKRGSNSADTGSGDLGPKNDSNSRLATSTAGLTQLSLLYLARTLASDTMRPKSLDKDSGGAFGQTQQSPVEMITGAGKDFPLCQQQAPHRSTADESSDKNNGPISLSESHRSTVQPFSAGCATNNQSSVSISGREGGIFYGVDSAGEDSIDMIGSRPTAMPPLPDLPYSSPTTGSNQVASMPLGLLRPSHYLLRSPSISASQQHLEDLPYVPLPSSLE